MKRERREKRREREKRKRKRKRERVALSIFFPFSFFLTYSICFFLLFLFFFFFLPFTLVSTKQIKSTLDLLMIFMLILMHVQKKVQIHHKMSWSKQQVVVSFEIFIFLNYFLFFSLYFTIIYLLLKYSIMCADFH